MAAPTIKVECAFASKPTDASYTWTDITSATRGISWSRGREDELEDMPAATGSIVVKDNLGRFDPRNTASPYYPNVKPQKPIRATATTSGVTTGLFQHFAQRWPRSSRLGSVYAERTIETSDGFSQLAQASLAVSTFPEETTTARVGRVLDLLPGWPVGRRGIDAGFAKTVVGGSYSDAETTTALQHLQLVTQAEDGLLYIDKDGKLIFIARRNLISNTSINATLTDAVSPPGSPYAAIVPSSEASAVRNEWVGTRFSDLQLTEASVQTSSDASSILDYSRNTATIGSFLVADTEVKAQLDWKNLLYAQPRDRLDGLTVMPGTSATNWAAVLLIELGTNVTVRETAPGFASAVVANYMVRKIDVTIPPNPAEAAFTYGLQILPPVPATPWLVIGDGTKGLLDTNRLGY